MKTLLVPVDFSAVTNAVVRAACDLAKAVGGRLVLLHVLVPPVVVDVYGLGQEMLAETVAASEQITTRKLRALARACTQRRVPVRAVQRQGAPVKEILAAAKRLRVDGIVLGTHGHGAAYDLIVGSTTTGVLRKAPCPVLVVPTGARR